MARGPHKHRTNLRSSHEVGKPDKPGSIGVARRSLPRLLPLVHPIVVELQSAQLCADLCRCTCLTGLTWNISKRLIVHLTRCTVLSQCQAGDMSLSGEC